MIDSTHFKPICGDTTKIPTISIPRNHNSLFSRCSSPSNSSSPVKFLSTNDFEEKLKVLGNCGWIFREDLIERLDNKYYKIGFWSSIQTKSLGTFIVVTTEDSKMHFLSMRRKISSCNFQYDFIKHNIYTRSRSELYNSSKEIEAVYYDFPEQVMILTPKEPYEVPVMLSKM